MSRRKPARADAMAPSVAWFAREGWTVFDFQRDTWLHWHAGRSGLVHSPTGSGKTLAAWLGPVQRAVQDGVVDQGLDTLWITPLRALANDTRDSLQRALDEHGVERRVELRTGDTGASARERQWKRPPFALVTTPESLSVMLCSADASRYLASLSTVIVDEWHELLGTKRGVQLQLCLARLRSLSPALRIWGLSATLANLDEALAALVGPGPDGVLVRGVVPREIRVESVLPDTDARFPWAGHMGLSLVPAVSRRLEEARTTLVFTNTRAQAELWFRGLLEARPEWFDRIALHHGSMDRELRTGIEARLKLGELRAVVCTSSLDLGVDFQPVDQVMQIGSPKGVARLMQRAGRSGHRPGEVSRILCVPANAFELVEIAAVRHALEHGRIESREPPERSLDVLCQHLVTIAAGAGFEAESMRAEVRRTHAFADLSDAEWTWVLDFITRGGQALQGYPHYHKAVQVAGVYRVMNREIARRHRLSIGTIASNSSMNIAFSGGKRLGTTDEAFVARLHPGDVFQFAGRTLELVRVRDMTAYVRSAGKRRSRSVPHWQGTQMPLSTELSDSVVDVLQAWKIGEHRSAETDAIANLLTLQARWSMIPGPDDFLIEYTETEQGHSLFCFPFAGRLAHEGMAMLAASRLAAERAITFELTVNDYGFEMQSEQALDIDTRLLARCLSRDDLLTDILHSVNTDEIAKRRFRDIARIAGLVFDGFPGRGKSAGQVQASSGLIYEVLETYDQDNLLLDQARREVLEAQLEFRRLATALESLERCRWHLHRPARLTPLAFPLWAETIQSQTQTVSSESWRARVESMLGSLEAAAADTLSDRPSA